MIMHDKTGTPASGALEAGGAGIRVGGFGSDALVLEPGELVVSPGEEVVWVLEEPGRPCVVRFEGDSPFGQQELGPSEDGRIRAVVAPSSKERHHSYEVRPAEGDLPAPARGTLFLQQPAAIPDVTGSGGPVTPRQKEE